MVKINGYKEKYFRLLDITMNVFTVLELEEEKHIERRKVYRLLQTFKEQVDEEAAHSPMVEEDETGDGTGT